MKIRILIIEDDPDIRENTAELLELSGYQVETASNGKEGLLKVRQSTPDLVLCDVMMPVLDGYAVLKALQSDGELARIPFIYLTAKTELTDIRKGMLKGADDYLTKPFDAEDLLEAVDLQLKKRSALLGHSGNMASSNEQTLEAFLHQYPEKKYKKRDVLFEEGATLTHIYYLLKGRVKLVALHSDGKEKITALLQSGDFIGHLFVMGNQAAQQRAQCLEDVMAVVIPVSDFKVMMHQNTEVSRQIMAAISEEVIRKDQELLSLAYSSVRMRVADGLLRIVAESNEDQIAAGIPLTREEMAQLMGIATETLIRTLHDFKEDGLIAINGRAVVPNTVQLKNLRY